MYPPRMSGGADHAAHARLEPGAHEGEGEEGGEGDAHHHLAQAGCRGELPGGQGGVFRARRRWRRRRQSAITLDELDNPAREERAAQADGDPERPPGGGGGRGEVGGFVGGTGDQPVEESNSPVSTAAKSIQTTPSGTGRPSRTLDSLRTRKRSIAATSSSAGRRPNPDHSVPPATHPADAGPAAEERPRPGHRLGQNSCVWNQAPTKENEKSSSSERPTTTSPNDAGTAFRTARLRSSGSRPGVGVASTLATSCVGPADPSPREAIAGEPVVWVSHAARNAAGWLRWPPRCWIPPPTPTRRASPAATQNAHPGPAAGREDGELKSG